ncbi:uncharacterized protein C8Q71DRAFT_322537 [Rhodofomes roseus]|uniref:Uncharacterized protein n=1 Tax=Rhodofomes roseus TaxID=34475 RepID=A0ABQ8K2N0_9APHY|nr:uncharacterized protein C8Q71DRAFT_322537 [Rhodofomes roseus]KAH9830794.1 hypothetical protein C8Q71DRAFT_322537 [Rhodofomes roseus]
MKHYRERLASSETSEYSIFPISAVRDEPFIPPTPGDTRATPTSASVEQPPVRVLRCLIREIPGFPGVLEDGRWTVRHPLVQTYLKNLGNVYDDAAGFTGASTSRGEPARDVRGCIEVGRVEDVGQVVGRHLSDVISEAVFILAALEVVDIIRHPAHFAFWGANVRERTSLIIQQSQAGTLCQQSPGTDSVKRRSEYFNSRSTQKSRQSHLRRGLREHRKRKPRRRWHKQL